jgi:DNA-binding NarL/FixJ family response regulator
VVSVAGDLRILVVDDHPVVRSGLSALLRTIDGLVVVGEASDGESAIAAVEEHRPDVVLMDVRLPGIDGIESTRRIRAARPEAKVLVLTMYDDEATVFTAMQAGASGYLLKDAEQEEIVRAVRAVAAGELIFGPGVAARVIGYFAGAPPAAIEADVYPFPELTDREREVLDLLAAGDRTAAIARKLYLSPKTVSNQLTSIFAKLQVAGRVEAIMRARQGGLGSRP